MSRFSPYLGIVAALALGIFVATFFGSATVSTSTVVIQIASSTLPITNSTATTSVQAAPAPKVVSKKIAPPPPSSASRRTTEGTAPAVESISAINASLDISASSLRGALVNIICNAPAGSRIHSISGSGVIIDSKGVILTNAHIGQYFLLANRGVSCTIRSGSPAVDKYDAELIYISPEWLRTNPNVLMEVLPSGNGEHDFAFLAVSKSSASSALPSSFPYISLAIIPPDVSTPVVIASYGAQFLESNQIASGLSPIIVFGSVKDVFTFAKNTIYVLALGGSAAAQEGSSGGGVADASGALVGTITTSTTSGTTDTRSLNAIAASYIRAEYASETGQPLEFLLAESPAAAIANFAPQISVLESIITTKLL